MFFEAPERGLVQGTLFRTEKPATTNKDEPWFLKTSRDRVRGNVYSQILIHSHSAIVSIETQLLDGISEG
jgi:hypothetical protein